MPVHPPPRVAIGLPVYNGEALLAEALDALLAQTYGDFELIVSDNASTDGTEAICRDYAARDRRVRYVRQTENRGAIWNFNEAFRLSRSPYFKWAAFDDLCAPTLLERAVEVLDQRPDVAWTFCRSRHIGPDDGLLLGDDTPEIAYAPEADGGSAGRGASTRASLRPADRFAAVLLGEGGCLDAYGLIRSEVIRRTPLYLPHFGAEKVFIAELALHGRYFEIPEPLFFARIHPKAAGSLRSARAQRRFMNPLARGRWQFTRLKLLAGYLSAVQRADLCPGERARCLAVVARYLLQAGKWKRVLASVLAGAGLVGDYPSLQSAGTNRGRSVPETSPSR